MFFCFRRHFAPPPRPGLCQSPRGYRLIHALLKTHSTPRSPSLAADPSSSCSPLNATPRSTASSVERYQGHFLPLLDAEHKYTFARLTERLSKWSPDKLDEEGYMITGLSAFWVEGSSYGLPIAAFSRGPGIPLESSVGGRQTSGLPRFLNGSTVVVSRVSPLEHSPPLFGSVLEKVGNQLRIVFPERPPHDLESTEWRIDLGQNEVSRQRMVLALTSLNAPPDSSSPPSACVTLPALEYDHTAAQTVPGTHLTDVLTRSFVPAAREKSSSSHLIASPLIRSFALRHSLSSASSTRSTPLQVEGDPILSHLNPSQLHAISTMFQHRCSLIQGPPGTGKSKTILEAVRLLKQHFHIPERILLCAFTNVAVDNLVEGLLRFSSSSSAQSRRPLKILRIGSPTTVRPSLHSYTLTHAISLHPQKSKLDQLEAEAERLRAYSQQLLEANTEAKLLRRVAVEKSRKRLWGEWFRVRGKIVREIVKAADVICTTCISAGSFDLRWFEFPIVFVDEAGMCVEPASLVALLRGSKHLALIGDHKQLPPVITSDDAKKGGLSVSLFERLMTEGQVPQVMLNTQYRMHPHISKFPSKEFYASKLVDGITPSHLAPPPKLSLFPSFLNGDDEHPVLLISQSTFPAAQQSLTSSWLNDGEARLVIRVLVDLLESNTLSSLKPSQIGILSPYTAQVSLISSLLPAELKGVVEVSTVDGFEGREKDVILFSTVRNRTAPTQSSPKWSSSLPPPPPTSSSPSLGILADRRRLNVGITRAKRGLILFGNATMLRSRKGAWRRYVQWLTDENRIVSLIDEGVRELVAQQRRLEELEDYDDVEDYVDLDREAGGYHSLDEIEVSTPTP